ncbi:MAG: radical SAM protein, partial [Elusimicrobiota bacterium]
MKKVLLVSPSLQVNAQSHSKDNSYGLGLAYLHAVLEKEGYDIRTLSYNNSDPSVSAAAMEAELTGFKPDFFLVQIFTMNRVESFKIIKKARVLLSDLRIIAGGVHASIYPAQLLDNYPLDCVVIGEGEATIVELLQALSSGEDLGGVRGIAYRRDGVAVITPQRPLIEELDSIPFPKHELFIKSEPLRGMGCILTSRGCPYRCSFCCLHIISRRRFRTRSVKNVVDEIAYITENFPRIKVLQLADDTFTLNQPRAIEICREIIRRGIKMRFLCSARIKPASVELFEVMDKAGFEAIGFGLETG